MCANGVRVTAHRVTAAVQNATHSALIAFGLSLKKIGYDAELAAKISTPPHRAMISVIQRMASINEPDTYWDIQTENPHAGESGRQWSRRCRKSKRLSSRAIATGSAA